MRTCHDGFVSLLLSWVALGSSIHCIFIASYKNTYKKLPELHEEVKRMINVSGVRGINECVFYCTKILELKHIIVGFD